MNDYLKAVEKKLQKQGFEGEALEKELAKIAAEKAKSSPVVVAMTKDAEIAKLKAENTELKDELRILRAEMASVSDGIEPENPTKSVQWCDSCDSKGVKHKKDCPKK